MKKLIICIYVAAVSTVNAECTREQAFNKMMKLNELSASLQSEVPLDPTKDVSGMNSSYLKMKDYTDRIAPAGPMLADGRYNEACKIYDDTAKHFGFNLTASKALTMDQLKKNGGKKNAGDCDISEMAKRNVKLATDFQLAYGEGKFTYEEQRQFSKDSEKLNMLATSDPGAACREMEVLRAKYGL
jgi:hypothetical protein